MSPKIQANLENFKKGRPKGEYKPILAVSRLHTCLIHYHNCGQPEIKVKIDLGKRAGSAATTAKEAPEPRKRTDLQKRAEAMAFKEVIMYPFIALNSDLKEGYINTLNCAATLNQEGTKLLTWYCNNRWCPVCNKIRTAKNINSYMEPLKQLTDKQFVTLTIPAVEPEKIGIALDTMYKAIRRIQDNMRKRHGRPIIGIRKTESNYNPEAKTFNPHFHFILESRETAELLKSQWLEQFKDANPAAQHIESADENSIMELFKYFTKILSKGVTGPDGAAGGIYYGAMDTLFKSMKGRRTFQPMGGLRKDTGPDLMTDQELDDFFCFGLDESESAEAEDIKQLTAYDYCDLPSEPAHWKYNAQTYDWINYETGEVLSYYRPADDYKRFLNNPHIKFDPEKKRYHTKKPEPPDKYAIFEKEFEKEQRKQHGKIGRQLLW